MTPSWDSKRGPWGDCEPGLIGVDSTPFTSWVPKMDLILFAIDFILHVDVHLKELFENYGVWVYAILFLIIFCETGLVVTPFLPGTPVVCCRCPHRGQRVGRAHPSRRADHRRGARQRGELHHRPLLR